MGYPTSGKLILIGNEMTTKEFKHTIHDALILC